MAEDTKQNLNTLRHKTALKTIILFNLEYNQTRTQESDILRFLPLIAEKIITISWLRPQLSMVTQWRKKVKYVYYMETINTRFKLKQTF